MKRIVLILLVLLMFSSVAFGEVSYAELKEKNNIPIDKEYWTIELSMEVDKASVSSDTVYIVDEDNTKVDTVLEVDDKKIIIWTTDNYNYNSKYTIFVENVISMGGESLNTPVKMMFVTEKEIDMSEPKEISITGEDFVEMGYPLFLDLEGYSYGGDKLSWDMLKDAKWNISNEEIAYLDPITKELWGYEGGQVIVTVELGNLKVDKTINILPLTVEEKANRIIREIIKPGMTDFEKVLEIHDYVVKNTRYDLVNKYKEQSFLNTKESSLLQGRAICGGYASALEYLLQLLDIETQFVVGRGANEVHGWLMVKLEEEWYHIDPTFDDALINGLSYNSNKTGYKYFLVSDDKLSKTHSWNKDIYPKANSKKYEHLNDMRIAAREGNMIYVSQNSFIDYMEDMLIKVKIDEEGNIVDKVETNHVSFIIDSDGQYIMSVWYRIINSTSLDIINMNDLDDYTALTSRAIDGAFIRKGWVYYYNDSWYPEGEGWYRIRLDGTDEHKI